MGSAVSSITQSVGNVAGGAGGTLLGGALGGSAGAKIGGILDQDRAAQEAIRAQQAAGDATLNQQERMRREAVLTAAPTEFELQRLEESLQANQRDLARREQILAAADPALIEAGKQALQLLRGEKEAGSLSVVRRQREQQRTQLMDRLRKQLGPGAETSTAGIQALTAFDQATDDLLQQSQERGISNLLGSAERSATNLGTQQNIANLGALSQLRGNISARQANAAMNTPVTAIGGQFTGDYLRALQQGKNAAAVGAMIPGGGGEQSGGTGSFGGLLGNLNLFSGMPSV